MSFLGVPKPIFAVVIVVVSLVGAVVLLPLITALFSLVGSNIANNPTLCPDGSICQNISNGTQIGSAAVTTTIRSNSGMFTIVWLFAILSILVTAGVLIYKQIKAGQD